MEIFKESVDFNLNTEQNFYEEDQNQFLATQAALADPNPAVALSQLKYLNAFRRGQEQKVRGDLYAQEVQNSRETLQNMIVQSLQQEDIADAEMLFAHGMKGVQVDPSTAMEVAASERLTSIAEGDPEFATLLALDTKNTIQLSRESALKSSIVNNWIKRFEGEEDEVGAFGTLVNWLGILIPLNLTGAQTRGFTFLAGHNMSEQAMRIHRASPEELPAILDDIGEKVRADAGFFGSNEFIAEISAKSILAATPDNAYFHDLLGVPLDLLGLGIYKGGFSAGRYLLLGGSPKVAGSSIAREVLLLPAPPDTIYDALPVLKAGDPGTVTTPHVRAALDQNLSTVQDGWNARVFAPRLEGEDLEFAGERIQALSNSLYGDTQYGAAEFVFQDGVYWMDTFIGTMKGNTFRTKLAAQSSAARKGYSKEGFEVVPSTDGGYLIKARQAVDESGFYGKNIDPETSSNWFSKWILSGASQVRGSIIRNSTSGKLEAGKFQVLQQELNKVFDGLTTVQRSTLQNIINLGKKEPIKVDTAAEDTFTLQGVWWNENQLEQQYMNLTGRLPSESEKIAYFTYWQASDLNHALLNDISWRRYAAQGFNTQQLTGPKSHQYIGKLILNSEIPEGSRVLDWATQNTFKSSEDIPEGQRVIQLSDRVESDGVAVKYITVDKANHSVTPLSREIIPYSAGGTRNYLGKWFVKHWTGNQSNKPSTWGVFVSRASAQKYIDELTQVQDLYRAYLDEIEGLAGVRLERIEAKFEAKLQETTDDFDTLDAVEDAIDTGRFSMDGNVKTTFDGEVFGAADEGLASFGEMYQIGDGRLYYSHRGEFLRGEEASAELINPYKALTRQQGHVAHNAGMSSFAIGEMNRFAAQFGKHLSVGNAATSTPEEIFLKGEWLPGTPQVIKNQGETMRTFVNRSIGNPTGSDTMIRNLKENTARWMEERLQSWDLPEGKRKKLVLATSDALLNGRDPVSILKGWAYDLHLGVFNMGQLFLQGSAALGAVAISPKYGLAASFDYWFLRAAMINSNAVEPMGRAWMRFSGNSMDEFIGMVEDAKKTGLSNIGYTDTVIDKATTTTGASSVATTVQKYRNIGRIPVYEGERIGRLTAFGIARREAKDRVALGEFTQGDDSYIAYIQGRTSALNMNMVSGAESAVQRDAFSALGTQFWAYPTRVMESVLGALTLGKHGNRTLTPRENASFIIGQGFLWGTMGIPLLDNFKDWYFQGTGTKLDEETYKVVTTGFVDLALRNMSGGNLDPALGANIGTSRFISDTYLDLTEDRSPLGLMGGVLGSDFNKLTDFAGRIYLLGENEKIGTAEFTEELVSEMSKLIKTRNNIVRAFYLAKSGVLLNARGETPITTAGPWNALVTGIGFPLWEEFKYYQFSRGQRNHFELMRDIGSMVAENRLKYAMAVLNGETEQAELLYRTQAGLLQILDPLDRKDALREANRISKRDGHAAVLSNKHNADFIPTTRSIEEL